MSLRPPNPKMITLADVKPGDILGSVGTSEVDRIVTLVDQGDYSHISQCVDVVDGEQYVVEATMGGIQHNPVKSKDLVAQDLVDCYRFVSKDGHEIGSTGWPVQPIIDVANTYPGGKYCWDITLMMGVVILGSRVPDKSIVREVIRIGGGVIVIGLEKWIQKRKNKGKTAMTCVQIATSAYYQAATDPEHKYGLIVEIGDERRAPAVHADQVNLKDLEILAYKKIKKDIEKLFRHHYGDTLVEKILAKLNVGVGPMVAGSDLLPLGACSPTDLQTSPSLKFIGCLKDTRKK